MVLLEISVMNYILRICKEFKWKVKVVLLEVSLINFILGISIEIIGNVKVVLLESIIDELHYSEIQQDQMEGESGVTRFIIDEHHS